MVPAVVLHGARGGSTVKSSVRVTVPVPWAAAPISPPMPTPRRVSTRRT